MIVFARHSDSNRKSKAVPADPGCSGVPGFPYTPKKTMLFVFCGFKQLGQLLTTCQDPGS